jgi:cytochrome bd-type quinol oxidase subunit 1
MDVATTLTAIESSGLAKGIRDSLVAFPLIEAAHVIGVTLVFGTITIIDLRLLGVASGHRPYRLMGADILKWTWIAFAVAAATGALMFITNAHVYFNNRPFQVKLALLVLAGVNMFVFQLASHRTVHLWDEKPSAPPAGKVAAVLSLALWISIIVMGRLIGFTSTQAATATAPPASVDFDDFLGGGDAGAPPPAQPK